MQSIETLISRIDDPQFWRSKPARDEEIRAAETALGVSFPPSYRAFLALYGGVSVVDSIISGIVDNAPLDPGTGSVVYDTMSFRKEWRLPDYYVVIQPDDHAPYCLDTRSKDAEGEMVVICYELHSEHAGVIATSFVDWLERFFVC
jgi:SMI1-KNR4 cell-wall